MHGAHGGATDSRRWSVVASPSPSVGSLTSLTRDPRTKGLYAGFVGADDKALGDAQAKALVEALEAADKPAEGGVLQIEGAPGAATTILRKEGF